MLPPNQTAYRCIWWEITCTSIGFGWKNRSQVKDTIGDMCGFRRRHYRSILNTSYFNINLFSLMRHSPPMPKEPLPSGDSLIASHYHRQQSSLSVAQSTFSGLLHVTSVSKAAILKEKILLRIPSIQWWQGCIFFPKIEFFINHYLEALSFLWSEMPISG